MLRLIRRRGHDGGEDHGHGDHGHGEGHAGHSHGVSAEADRRYLVGALCLIAGFMAFEVVAAVVSGSLVLVADAGHMLTDAGALAGSLWALRLAARPPGGTLTFGLKRAEVLSAQANGVTLVVMALVLAYEAIHRLLAPPPVEGLVLVVVAGVGVGVNLAATWSLARANRDSMNVEGSFQHILTDLYAFLATVVAGLVIFFLHWRWADPVASLVVVALMLRAGWGLLRDSGRVLLQAAPDAVDLEEVRRHMAELPEVVSVHDLHAWTLSSKLPVLSAHVVVNDACLADGSSGRVLDHLQACLADHFDVEHSTFQLEPASHPEHEVPDHR